MVVVVILYGLIAGQPQGNIKRGRPRSHLSMGDIDKEKCTHQRGTLFIIIPTQFVFYPSALDFITN